MEELLNYYKGKNPDKDISVLNNSVASVYYNTETNTIVGVEIIGNENGTVDLNGIPEADKLTTIAAHCDWRSYSYDLECLVLPRNIEIVGSCAFASYRFPFKKVIWPDYCRQIPYKAFAASAVEEVENIDRVEEIDSTAFDDCYFLTDEMQERITKELCFC